MLRKAVLAGCVATILQIFSSCSLSAPTVLVMAEVNPPDTIAGRMDAVFKEKVEELSKGRLRVDIQYSGILGDEEDILAIMTQPESGIQLARISAYGLTPYGCKKSSLMTIPYTFADRRHYWNFARSGIAQEILDEPYEIHLGVKGLFLAEEGFRHFFSVRKLRDAGDFANARLRMAADPVSVGIAEGLGAQHVSIGFSELYSALQVGAADIAEQPIANYLANHLNKVAPHMILDGHTLGVMEVVIAAGTWDKLTARQRDMLTEAGAYAGEYCRKISEETENAAKAALVSEGVEFTEVADKAEFQSACAGIISASAQDNLTLYEQILAFGK